MDDRLGVHVAYDESDIIKNCKYCRKVNKKSIAIGGAAYGYECIIKREKRRMNRCRQCYFGSIYFK